MKRALDNAVLANNLNANGFRILNIDRYGDSNFVTTDDPRLSDARNILDGTVTNDNVSETAAIDQSKLAFNGPIPPQWLGTTSDTAASGLLSETILDRNDPLGHPSLDAVTGKMPSGSVAIGAGTGSLVDIDFEFPVAEFTTIPSVSGTTRHFTIYWLAQNAQTFFGNMSGDTATPSFFNPVIDISLIPGIDGSQFTLGTFSTDNLPVAIGTGAGHSIGLAPTTGMTGEPSDYLGRDMTYRAMIPPINYQPTLWPPAITVQSYFSTTAIVNITSQVKGTNIFYRTPPIAGGGGPFIEVTGALPLKLAIGTNVDAYVAKNGYNNSNIASYTIPPPGQS